MQDTCRPPKEPPYFYGLQLPGSSGVGRPNRVARARPNPETLLQNLRTGITPEKCNKNKQLAYCCHAAVAKEGGSALETLTLTSGGNHKRRTKNKGKTFAPL